MTKLNRTRPRSAKIEPPDFTPEQIQEMRQSLDRFERNIEFFEKNREKWLEKYPRWWVAVQDQKLVGRNKNLQRLLKKLRADSVELASAYIKFMERSTWILLAVS